MVSCRKKWDQANKNPRPKTPPGLWENLQAGNVEGVLAYNTKASAMYNDTGMDKCTKCGRTFLPDRLVVHARGCKGRK